jgi:hypothetical protein
MITLLLAIKLSGKLKESPKNHIPEPAVPLDN